MGYFPNGTAGMEYEGHYCSRCVNYRGGACPVWQAHMLYNYDQHEKTEKGETLKKMLDFFIPRRKDGLGNKRCAMFKAVKTGSDPDDGEPMLFKLHEIGGKPIEVKETA